jgi:hypothetical protein
MHMSLWKDGKNLFAGNKYAGLSEMALYYIGGVLKHAPALCGIINPTTNSYKRLVPGFEAWLQSTQTAQKYSNIQQYLDSPTSNRGALQAAFVLFELLHDLKLDLLGKLDQQVPGNEGWVFATPAGYGKAVNRFDFSARNKARNNPPAA